MLPLQTLTNWLWISLGFKPTLDTISGNPLDYTNLRAAFRDKVESFFSDEIGRLNRLMTHTSGAAKELVQMCVYFDDQKCFTKAMDVLHQEFGKKVKIASTYIQPLKDMPAVKVSDLDGWKKTHRFLLKCKTFKSSGQLSDLVVLTFCVV